MNELRIDVRGQTCPVPLVETRKAIMKAARGDTIRIVGTHPSSMQEIPMAAKAFGLRHEVMEATKDQWVILIYR